MFNGIVLKRSIRLGFNSMELVERFPRKFLIAAILSAMLVVPCYAENEYEPSYTLTPVEAKGDNTITKFVWNEESKSLVPQYYRLDLKQTEYGEGDGVKYYEWQDDKYLKIKSVEVSAPTEGKTTITAKYSLDNQLTRMENTGVDISLSPIKGDFIGNSTDIQGGAIYSSQGTIGDIIGNFVGNFAGTVGGAIFNDGGSIIGNITGNFVGNSADNYAGAINNSQSSIGNIEGDFIGNLARAGAGGGAIYNYDGSIGDITGDFIGNSAGSVGGAIYNSYGSIGDINGDFIGNSASHNAGAIYNSQGSIGNIKGDFIGNLSGATGGAIFNDGGTINNIKGDFIGNSARYVGAAIYNSGQIGDIIANFVGNSAFDDSNGGGAIYNSGGTINNITGDFIGNYGYSGGAINNNGTIASITSNFIGNSAKRSGGALLHGGPLASIAANFIGNSAGTYGGAIFAYGVMNLENSSFINNYVASTTGISQGGAIFATGGVDLTNTSFINNYVTSTNGTSQGGAIYTTGKVDLTNTSFINNYATSDYAQGGAIWTPYDITITAQDGGASVFSGNYVEDKNGKRPEAIYTPNPTINIALNANTNGKIVFDDQINGYYAGPNGGYKLKITGDNTGKVVLNNDIINSMSSLENTNLYLGRETVFNESNLALNSGFLSTVNGQTGVLSPRSFTVNGNTNMAVDVDLATETMDRIETANYGTHNGNLIVNGMNLLSDTDKNGVSIYFAQEGLKDNVQSTVGEMYTPLYKYNVAYDNRDDGGYFVFSRGNKSSDFNPSVLATPASAQAGGQSVVNETVRFAFQHADYFSQMPFAARIAYINRNKYAIAEGTPVYSNGFEKLDKGYWVKPFASFENIKLHNGPDVDAITYGTLVGFDSDFKELKHGWYNVKSAYIGYNGSTMNYQGVDTTLNGGLLGLTETFYKGNFFTALTGTAGASVGTNSTMYGNEDFTMLLGGIGTKTGYNFEFKNGKYILQPIMFMNYSFVNTFDYTNAAGVRMKNSPFHTLQINPSLKFITHLKNEWQPYASVGFVWNVLNCGKVRANNVVLPNMSVDPYVEYGLGVQKSWKDKFTGFAQAMVRNGGRNGVALTFGFRWAIGKDSEDL